jgi:hypothetical protein
MIPPAPQRPADPPTAEGRGAIAFLHTARAHVATFEELVAELGSEVPRRHVVEPGLLAEARTAGVTTALEARVRAVVEEAAAGGASVVVCTCSTIGACAEAVTGPGFTAMRIDRPMAEAAVRTGPRIAVVAALASTVGPTRALLLDAASRAGVQVAVTDVACEDAWPRFEAGDVAGYLAIVARTISHAAAGADVVVLAQASMAGAAALCRASVPVLASPRLGVEAALRIWRARGPRP